MKNILFYAFFLILASRLSAQEPFAKMVIGLEAAMDLGHYSEGVELRRPFPGLHVEYPFKKFSFGAGISRKVYPESRYKTFDRNISSVQVGASEVTVFQYTDKVFRPVYWSIPLRIQYRLPCNCVYVQGAASLDFFDTGAPEKVESTYWSSKPPTRTWSRRQYFKSTLRTYELGIGFKLHSTDYFRLVARPSFVWSENPEIGNGPAYLRSLRMSFGIQYAFIRYGGKM
ncbi:MAG: hypothetical protein IPJ82_19380 [Lewinellaceae bacterium]|nr:hypothetical protein [Lewinellaceae bacterium]